MSRRGILFVLSGPSGAGKGTVLSQVINCTSGLAFSVSVTTRAPRAGEIDGIHYYFRSNEEFERMVENGEFLEYVSKFKNKYGTPRAQVEECLDKGTDVILEIETHGAAAIRKNFPGAVFVFITPSTYDELSRRLAMRGTENEKTRELRLKIARTEYKSIVNYQYVAVNDDLESCVKTVKSIIYAERAKRERNPELVESLKKLK